MSARLLLAPVLAAAALLLGMGPAPAAATGLGLFDDPAFNDNRTELRGLALTRADRAGASLIRFTLDWSLVAPEGETKPDGFAASDPDAREYEWGYVEEFVRDAHARGFRVLLTVVGAPRWAEGAGRPADAPAGSWRPDPAELRAFVRAAARRFSGFFPDPQRSGRALPRVRYWQIWDEPNRGVRLQPLREAAGRYRDMLNGAAGAIRGVNGGNVVVTAGTAAGGRGIAPVRFWRDLLCLRAPCGERLRFDVYAHHPVAGRAGPGSAGPAGDVRVASVSRLTELVARARRAGRLDSGRKRLWVTKLGWDSRPFVRRGLSQATQASHLSSALWALLRRGRAEQVVWGGLRDAIWDDGAGPRRVGAGLFFQRGGDPRDDRAKPAHAAFRFPFVVRRSGAGAVAWGIVPRRARARVTIQLRRGGRWRTAARTRAAGDGEFRVRLAARRGTYRAHSGGSASPVARYR